MESWDHCFEVHLRKVAANITTDLELNPEALNVFTKVLDEPLVAFQRCNIVMLDAWALYPLVIVSIVDIFENRFIWE